jgi:hypothetical protein
VRGVGFSEGTVVSGVGDHAADGDQVGVVDVFGAADDVGEIGYDERAIVMPWRRKTSAIFAGSGGPPADSRKTKIASWK